MHRIAAEPLDALRMRTSAKWRSYADDVLPLPVAEMDYPLAEPIAAALHAAIRRSDTGYHSGSRPVAEAFEAFAATRLGWKVDPGRVTCTADVSMGIVEVLRRVTSPGDGVIITPPIYPPFFDLVTEASAVVVEVPMAGGIDEGWSLDLDGIDAAFAAGAKAMVLCNPHNPIGLVPDASQLTSLAEIAARHGVTIVSDEVHGPLVQPGVDHTPFLMASDAAREHGVAITSASKSFNIPGLKSALIVTASERGDRVRTALPYEVEWRMGQFGAIASIAAFTGEGTGSTACSAVSTTTGACSPTSSPTNCRGCATACPTRPTSPGSICRPWAGATTLPHTRSSTRRSRSASAPSSGRPSAEGTCDSTSRARPRCSTRRSPASPRHACRRSVSARRT